WLIEQLYRAPPSERLRFPGAFSAASQRVLAQLFPDAVHDDATIAASATPRSVAEAARLVGLSTHTLRSYEQEGLVPARNASGYREYSAADLRRLVFLARMRLSGMTMADLRRYILLVGQGPSAIP
ncbi:MerR family transcriptional regulator, partial [Micromonospora rifamycinica]|uniref:MerR family transcriptional regulator n=1 Tax=Micromonospora rifamycinica TaxID=291594 RepID=UPI00341A8587